MSTPSFPTSLGTSEGTTITLLGQNLADDLMGHVGFGELAYWLLTLERPTPQQARLFEAVLLGLADHGFTPTAIAARLESAENRVKLRSLMTNERVDDALSRFDQLERRVDYAEGRADALSIADGSGKPSLSDEIAALAGQDQIDDELAEMKRALGLDEPAGDADTKEG